MPKSVLKFGGTSLSTPDTFRLVKETVDKTRGKAAVIVSAPGKRFAGDTKVTDILYRASDELLMGKRNALCEAVNRLTDIRNALQLSTPTDAEWQTVEECYRKTHSRPYLVSRGEYFTAKMLAEYCSLPFCDAKDIIFFDSAGKPDINRIRTAAETYGLTSVCSVIPGFYGITPRGKIKLFSRGGSDVTGALAAEAVGADVYWNYTDVPGVYAADPRIIATAHLCRKISYDELRILSHYGASVLHEDAVFPVKRAGIPIVIKSTFLTTGDGTYVSNESEGIYGIAGIASCDGYAEATEGTKPVGRKPIVTFNSGDKRRCIYADIAESRIPVTLVAGAGCKENKQFLRANNCLMSKGLDILCSRYFEKNALFVFALSPPDGKKAVSALHDCFFTPEMSFGKDK